MMALSESRLNRKCCAFVTCFSLVILTLAPTWVWGNTMEEQFVSPPNSAKPRVWWHWMDGNITKEGIEADLQWMKRVGIGGLHNVDVGLNTPQLVENRLGFMTPAWREAFRFTASLAAELELELGIFSSPGWSETGGPWVRPDQAMKKLVWSKTLVKGGSLFNGKLPDLPKVTGPFQNISGRLNEALTAWDATQPVPEYHKDSVVIAYREPEGGQETGRPLPKITSSAGLVDAGVLNDGDTATRLTMPPSITGKPQWIQFEYEKPEEIRSISVSVSPPGSVVNLAVSDDGKKYRHIKSFYIGSTSQSTVTFAPIRAKLFRLKLRSPGKQGKEPWGTSAPGVSLGPFEKMFHAGTAPPLIAHDIVLRQGVRVNRFELKAGFEIAQNYYAIATPPVPQKLTVRSSDVVDLTGHMRADGSLQWQAPPGDWVVLRMGYSLTGSMNHPASREATGLEVDKLNRGYVEQYLDTYLGMYTETVGPSLIGERGLNAFMTDSLEIRPQNWTDDILQQFERLRGYDPRPWLPTLTGIVVDGAEQSDKFLWDFRKTLSDLLLDSHYKVIAETTQQRGLTLYGEALESLRLSLGDDMDLRRYTDVPTAAMWTFSSANGPKQAHIADIQGAASVAHIYGQNLVGAESLTSALAPWASAPRHLKPIIDLEFALGVNRPIIHTSVHQPLSDLVPGFSLSIFGQHFNRHETWAEQSKGWIDYLSRSSFMLQQGRYVADIAYFYGEEAPLISLFGTSPPSEIPHGYGFDFVNADVILNQLSVKDGEFITRSGMRYRLLYLGGSSTKMTLPVLRKLRALVAAGGVIVGAKPIGSPSLADDPVEFRRLAEEVWGSDDLQTSESRSFELGKIFHGPDIGAVLAELNLPEDFKYVKADASTKLMYQHRQFSNGHIYFVSNRSDRTESVEATFRVDGKQVELWHADTGAIEKTSFRMEDNRTIVPLTLGPYESLFVVFQKLANDRSLDIKKPDKSIVATLNDSWGLLFPRKGAESVSIKLSQLASWSEQPENSIKYFSGTATYTREITAPDSWFEPGTQLKLDLGEVFEIAEPSVNGQSLEVLWKPPYIVDVTDLLHPGSNTLEVKVTNLWVNRLIGDQQPGVTSSTVTSTPTYRADAPLRPSGLIGPVKIEKFKFH